MRFLLNIILILSALLACYIEEIYLYFWPPAPEQALYLTVRSHRTFSFDQEKALEVNRQKALSQYVPVFRYRPERIQASKQTFERFIGTSADFQDKKQKGIEDLRNQLQKDFGVQLSPASVINIIRYRDLKNLLEGILTVEESILQNKILRDPQHLMGKTTIEIQNPHTSGAMTQSVDDLMSLEKARFLLEEKVRQLFWQVDKSVLDPVLQISLATLQPNVEYDQRENEQRLEKIKLEFPSQIVSYQPGDVLVPFRKILNDKDVLLLDNYQRDTITVFYRDLPWVAFTIFLIVIFYNLFLSRILANGVRNQPPYRFLLSLLITSILILKACLVFTPFPIYALPFCLLPMLIISLNHSKIIAAGTTLMGAMLVSLFAGPVLSILLFLIFGGLAAVLVSSGLRKRLQIMIPSLLVGFINAISVIVFTLDWQTVIPRLSGTGLQAVNVEMLAELADAALITDINWAFIGGLAAGPLALLLLPLLEISWRTASTFKLNRYTDLNRPLMKELLAKAPGTYQHSMAVAHLAQAVGEAIGANTLLLRIGAYYHDIGKMTNPKYFIENQFNGENPHDVLDPRESAKLIVDHARNGLRIGQESRLPQVVVDMILQHHGTQLMEYFYDAAVKSNPRSLINEEEFRYPGPKPQSVEAAVLMIADAVEAASRSLQDPTRKKFEKMIRLILVKRLVDGQFGECDVTSRDLTKIVRALTDALEASYHSRIRYPWQEKKKPPQKTSWRIGAGDEKDREDRAFRL